MNVKFPNGVKNVEKGDVFNIRCTPEKRANTLLMNSFIGQVLSVNNDYIEFVKNFGAFKRTYPVSKIFSADLIYRPGNKSIVLNSQRIYFNQTYVLLSGMKRLVYQIKTRILGVDGLYIILEDGIHLAICEIKSIKKVK